MWKWLCGLFSAMETFDAGLSLAERFGNKVPKFLFRHDYYFEEVNKKVFVKKNGDGFVVCACDLYVIRPEKVNDFVRGFDISDGKKSCRFPKLKTMQRRNINFFEDYGFWCDSQNNFITSVEENYDSSSFDIKRKEISERKCIGVKFHVDKSLLKSKQKYRFVYGFSVPGLYPVNNGKHDRQEYDYKQYGKHSSYIDVKHLAKNLRFAIYLERGMKLQEAPFGHAIKPNQSKEIEPRVCEVRDNLMYTKYLYTLKRPEKYQSIWVDWKLG